MDTGGGFIISWSDYTTTFHVGEAEEEEEEEGLEETDVFAV